MSGAALSLNSSTIGVSFDRMNAAKRKLGRAQEEAQAEKDSLSRAISSLQVEDGRLRQKAEALNRLRSKVSNRVADLQRVGSHVDYAVQRFTEVDNQCAQKIKTGGYEVKKTVGISNQGGIFGNVLGGLVSIADKGKAAWEKATNWVKDHKSEILKGLAIGLIAAASIALGVVTLGASVPAELALLSLLGGSALVGGGISLGMAEAGDLLGDGKLNLSAKQYLGFYAGGAVTGALLPLGGELLPAANAIWGGTCAMTGNVIEQYIGTGKVDHSQAIMAGASAGVFSYGLNKLIPVLTGRSPNLKIPSTQTNKAAALESQTAKETSSLRFTGSGMAEYDTAAEAAYNSIRSVKMKDVQAVARNTGLSVEEVTTMKKHLFFGKHKLPLEGGQGWKLERFAADDEIAHAWQSAQNGELSAEGKTWFRQLADHELGERKLMGQGMPYRNPNSWNPVLERFDSFPPGAHDAAPAQPGFNFPGYDPFKFWEW